MSRLVALAGLPGTGKSTLADRLAWSVGGVVLNKDRVRAALFPPPALDYTPEPDDLSMEAIYAAAGWILAHRPGVPVLIDGRTFTRRRHVDRMMGVAAGIGVVPAWIECVCSDEVAERRLTADHAAGVHLAGNRTMELYRRQKAAAEPLTVDRLVLDTGELSADECLRRAVEYVGRF